MRILIPRSLAVAMGMDPARLPKPYALTEPMPLGTDPGIVTALEASLQSIFASAPPPDTLWLLPSHPLYAQAIAAAKADAQEPGAV